MLPTVKRHITLKGVAEPGIALDLLRNSARIARGRIFARGERTGARGQGRGQWQGAGERPGVGESQGVR